ncbi:hypothetical protein Tco_0497814 [Tanacetum coccineum]
MTTLSNKAILSGADNRPPMLEKDMYDSWKSIMELYMLNRQNGRMILESIESGLLIWPSIVENRVTRPKKYFELSATEALQVDCDIKATNIILQGLPPEVYALLVLDKPLRTLLQLKIKAAGIAEYIKHSDVAVLCLGKMSPALQRQSGRVLYIVSTGHLDYRSCPFSQVFSIKRVGITRSNPQGGKTSRKNGERVRLIRSSKLCLLNQRPNPRRERKNPNKDQACHHCHMTGHWKRNCPLYLEELRANKKKSEHSAAGSGGFNAERKLVMGINICIWAYGAQAVVEMP